MKNDFVKVRLTNMNPSAPNFMVGILKTNLLDITAPSKKLAFKLKSI